MLPGGIEMGTLLAAEGGSLIDFNLWNVIWTWVIFGITLYILSKVAWPMLRAKMEEREVRIQDNLEKAEKLQSDAQGILESQEKLLEEARQQAQEIIAEGRSVAETMKSEAAAAAQRELAEERERAKKEIAMERAKAVEEVKHAAVDLVLDATGRLLQREVKEDDHRRLAAEVLSEVERIS